MIYNKNILLPLILLLSFTTVNAQEKHPKDYFISPLKIPMVLSGSFGELRSNHFHSGIDLKTNGATGYKVYAIGDGYVSRIKVSPWGYGLALYIKHPNGYTSVYAHLKSYNETIAKLVKATQYKKQSFAVEIFPKAGSIMVKKGECIALSGNSGGSGGPHLHFEIRDSKTEEPINPLFFGYNITDNQYPIIRELKIYNHYDNNKTNEKSLKLSQKAGKVELIKSNPITIESNNFHIGIEGYDQWDAAINKNGYYKLEYYFDDSIFFQFVADRINFNQQRYINSHIDYREYKKTKKRFQSSLLEPNNLSKNFRKVTNNGIVNLNDTLNHKIKIIAYDYSGQQSILEFEIKLNKKDFSNKVNGNLFKWNIKNTFENDGMKISIPAKALYSDHYFWVNTLDNPFSSFSKMYEIYDIGVPLHKYCSINIKVDSIENKNLISKLCIISLSTKNQKIYEGGKYNNGSIETKTRSFGKYFIDIDTIAPTINPSNIYNNKNISKQTLISFKVVDDLSGIKSYKAKIDNKWVLLEYDPKRSHFFYRIDESFPKGKHIFRIEIKDNRDNINTKEYSLIRN